MRWFKLGFTALAGLCLVAAATLAGEGPEISGRVLNPDASPAAQASVSLVYFDGKDFRDGGTTVADAQGHFRIVSPAVANPSAPTES
ncbi:MAG TPA: hypothetical protein VGJ09_06995 [Bryobacteraceae bacterium]